MKNNFLRRLRGGVAAALALAAALVAPAYDLIYGPGGARVYWDSGPIPFVIRMAQTPTLQDGSNHATSVQAAMVAWNAQLANVQFAATIAGPGLAGDGDGVNEIAFDSRIYSNAPEGGEDYGPNVLAVTLSYRTASPRGDGSYGRAQSDILFNTAWNWNSYRGSLQAPEDIRRVAIHELGHVLGLDHPDQAGQTVTAIMNSTVSSIDALQTDDLTGAQFLYGRPGGFNAPANDHFASASAVTLSGTTATVTGSSIGATKESGEPNHAPDEPGGASIWWKWTATSNGTLTVTTAGSAFDTMLGVYTGSAVSALTQLAANDDVDPGVVRTSTATVTVTSGTTYYFAVDGWDGWWGSVRLNLSFVAIVGPPVITRQPAAIAVSPGAAAQFSVGVSATTTYSLRWEMAAPGSSAWMAVPLYTPAFSGADSSVVTVAGPEVEYFAGYSFRCVATNSVGAVTSDGAVLSLAASTPLFTRRPRSVKALSGSALTISAEVSGSGPMTYVWRRNGVIISGASGAALTFEQVAPSDSGWYDLTVSNNTGSARSVFHISVARPRSTPVAWGNGESGQTQVPAGMGPISAVSAGGSHVLALKNDGTVTGWGTSFYGQLVIPSGLSNVVAIAAGGSHSLALKADGTVVGWGDGPWDMGPAATVPANLNGVVSIAAGGGRSVALRSNGSVVTWGWLSGDALPANLKDVVEISASPSHVLALRADGSVAAWGQSYFGETVIPAGLANVVAVAAGGSVSGGHNLALKSDGTVVAWGYNTYGQCNVPTGLNSVIAVAAGGNFSVAQKSDGTIVAWGQNTAGQLDSPSHSLLGVSAGYDFVAGLAVAALPSVTVSESTRTVNVGDRAEFSISVSGLGPFSYQWKKNGVALANGGNYLGVTTNTLVIQGAPVEAAGTYTVEVTNAAGTVVSGAMQLHIGLPSGLSGRPLSRVINEGESVSFSIQPSGLPPFSYVWRHNRKSISGAAEATLTLQAVSKADSGIYEVLVTGPDGGVARSVFVLEVAVAGPTLVGWGDYPPVANKGFSTSLAGVWGGGLSQIKALALTGEGTIIPLGAGNSSEMTPPSTLTDVVGLALGYSHGVALLRDGTVQCWGANYAGQASPPPGLSDVVAVSAGATHTIALKADGMLVGWGTALYGQLQIPAGLKNVIAVQTGRFDTTALLADGTVVQWGFHYPGGAANLRAVDLIAIAAGESHTLGLKSDGTVVAWGSDYAGSTQVPAGLAGVVAIAAGDSHSVALKSDGTMVGWGRDYEHQATPPAGLPGAFGLAAGGWWSVAMLRPAAPVIGRHPQNLRAALGSAATFSVGASGLSMSYRWQQRESFDTAWSDVADGGAISGSATHTLRVAAVTMDMSGRRFRCIVANSLGAATSEEGALDVFIPPPTLVTGPRSQVVVSGSETQLTVEATSPVGLAYEWFINGVALAGANSAILIIPSFQVANEGTYTVRISNAGGAVSASATISVATLPRIAAQPISQSVHAGESATFSVSASSNVAMAYQWKKNDLPIDGFTSPSLSLSSVKALDAGDYTVIVSNIAGSVTSAAARLTVLPSVAPIFTQQPVSRTIAVSMPTTFSVAVTGQPAPTYQWQRLPAGSSTWANVDPGSSGFYGGATTPTLMLNVATLLANNGDRFRCVATNLAGSAISAEAILTVSSTAAPLLPAGGYNFAAFLRLDGSVWAMGRNQEGQLGDGTAVARLNPVQVITGGVSLAAGADHLAVLKSDGSLWATGYNPFGALGDGSTLNRASFVQIAQGASRVAAGVYHTLFTKTDGTLWAAGWNNFGQLGDGSVINRPAAVPISSQVTALAGSYAHSVFVKSDGTLWAMGTNGAGQFGDGSTAGSLTPRQIGTNAREVAAGYYHSLVIDRAGALWASGYNGNGQIGDGTTTTRLSRVMVDTEVAAAAAGVSHSVYLKTDGTLWAMGANDRGQLGTGNTTARSTPVQVASGVTSISAGLFTTYFAKVDGSLWAAGANDQGQLGDGSTSDRTSFVQIAAGGVGLPADFTQPSATNSAAATRVTVTWPHSRGATHYRVLRSTTNDSAASVAVAARVVGNFHEDFSGISGISYYYWVQPVNASGALGAGLSALGRYGATLTPPTITSLSNSRTVTVGESTAFTVVAEGSAPLSYQWRKGSVDLAGQNAARLSINNATLADTGDYSVVVSNAVGSVTSSTITLTVNLLSQTITFEAPADRTFTSTPIVLTAAASSGLPVSFSILSGPAALAGNSLTLTGPGVVTIRATQLGNSTYAAAPHVDRSFVAGTTVAAWAAAQFTADEMNDPATSGPNADPDGDGLPNLLEYALGLSPRANSAAPAEVAATENEWSYTFTRPADRADLTYTVECSTNLTDWSSLNVTLTRVGTADGVETWRATTARTPGANCFLRLRVSR